MKNETEKTYNIEEIREFMDRYLDLSATRLRSRLRAVWKKQANFRGIDGKKSLILAIYSVSRQ